MDWTKSEIFEKENALWKRVFLQSSHKIFS